MKSNNISASRIRFALALILAALAAGCASRGYQKSDAAAATLQSAAGEVQSEARALDVTLNSLNDLVNKPPPDLKLQFEAFSSNLNQLNISARRNESMLRRVAQKSAAYFAAWDKEIETMSYEAVKTRSRERRNEVYASFDSVYRRYQETQATVGSLLDYFQDIRKALSADLTAGGLEAMKASISNVNTNAEKVGTGLSKLADELAAVGTRMSSVTVQNTQP